jgi:photosystem II stability/assembly factor-like uncharacterized protein
MKIPTTISFILCSFFLHAQPWLYEQYKESGKTDQELTVQDHIRAFDLYWASRIPEKGKGFMAFSRWKEFAEIRSLDYNRIPSEIYFSELMKDRQYKSVAGNWTYIGANETPLDINTGERSGSGRVNAIEFHPTNNNIIYIGAPAGGLWKSTNGGVTWQTTTDQLGSIGVSDVVLHPQNPEIVYIATGDADASDTYSIGLLKSPDGGNTWETTGYNPALTSSITISRILINQFHPDTILLATSSGMRLSANGGTSFSIVKSGNFRDMKYKPGNPSVVYASTYNYYGGATVYKSENGGKNWTAISPPAEEMDSVSRISIGVSAANPNVIYLLTVRADQNSFYALYRSDDQGATWTRKFHHSQKNLLGYEANGSDDGGQGWYDLTITVSPANANTVVVGGVNLWRSYTGGTTFNLIGHWWGDWAQYVHADQHIAKFQPGTNNLFAGNDGGLYKSTNDGNSWADLSDGLHIMQIYRINVAAHGSDMVILGTQDNGTMTKLDWLWNYVLGGDGMDCMIDQSEPGTMFAEYYYGSLYRTVNGGYSWDYIKPSQAADGAWITPLAMAPNNSNVIYAGYEDVYRSSNQGNSWSRISTDIFEGDLIKYLALAPSDPSVIIAGRQDKLMRTTNNGTSWTSIYNGIFSGQISWVTISPENPNKIWVSCSGYIASRKVFYSADGGITWTGKAAGMPNVPVNCLVVEPGSPDRIYAGTDLGVYVTDTLLSSWIPFKNGMPNTIVNELEISHNELIAATYGRGLWKSDLLTEYPQNVNPVFSTLPCRIFPNPASETVSISLPVDGQSLKSLRLSSPDGKLICSESFSGNLYQLNISHIKPGLYILNIECEGKRHVSKLKIM